MAAGCLLAIRWGWALVSPRSQYRCPSVYCRLGWRCPCRPKQEHEGWPRARRGIASRILLVSAPAPQHAWSLLVTRARALSHGPPRPPAPGWVSVGVGWPRASGVGGVRAPWGAPGLSTARLRREVDSGPGLPTMRDPRCETRIVLAICGNTKALRGSCRECDVPSRSGSGRLLARRGRRQMNVPSG